MIKNIIVPTDFSPCADNALHYAIELAKKLEAKLHVVYVHSINHDMQNAAIFSYHPPLTEFIPVQEEVFKKMEEVEKELRNFPEVEFETYIKQGFLNGTLLALAENTKYGLVVMGTQQEQEKIFIWTDTNTSLLIDKKKIQVISVPEKFKGNLLGHPEFIYACDFEQINDWFVMDAFYELATKFEAKITVFHVMAHSEDETHKAHEQKIFKELTEFFEGVDVSLRRSYRDDVIEAVNGFAKMKNAALVMMVTHQRGWIAELFHKSISKEMNFRGNFPLLTIPDNKQEEQNITVNTNYW